MKRCFIAITLFITVAVLTPAACFGEMLAKELRVGTFKRTELLVAFYGSATWDQYLKQLKNEREKAKIQGDEDKVKEIEARGAKSQEYAHHQLAGEAPLDNIFDYIRDELPAIAKSANVEIIVEKLLYKATDIQVVDITQHLVNLFPKKTKK